MGTFVWGWVCFLAGLGLGAFGMNAYKAYKAKTASQAK